MCGDGGGVYVRIRGMTGKLVKISVVYKSIVSISSVCVSVCVHVV